MKYTIIMLLITLCFVLSGCVFIDDGCHYETKCTYTCDVYTHECFTDNCWEELVCDEYVYYN